MAVATVRRVTYTNSCGHTEKKDLSASGADRRTSFATCSVTTPAAELDSAAGCIDQREMDSADLPELIEAARLASVGAGCENRY